MFRNFVFLIYFNLSRAKLPLAEWFRPALWLMPAHSVYGGWPASGEVDIMESSGNRDYFCG